MDGHNLTTECRICKQWRETVALSLRRIVFRWYIDDRSMSEGDLGKEHHVFNTRRAQDKGVVSKLKVILADFSPPS
jgi:hypothetical protein